MVGAGAMGVGASALATGEAEGAQLQASTVYDAVDDLGMDPTGSDPIDDALDEAYGDDVRIEFPPGEYLFTRSHGYNDDVDTFELVGLGSSRRDVQFVVPDGYDSYFLNVRSGRNHVLKNFSIDITDDSVTGVTTIVKQDDGLLVEDVELIGFSPDDEKFDGAGRDFAFSIDTRDGVGTVRNLVDTGGGIIKDYPYRRIAIWVSGSHVGELDIVDCHVENCGGAPVYGTRHQGCVRVEGGLWKNNDHQQLRVSGGHPEKRSWIRDARVVIDFQSVPDDLIRDPLTGIRGIWVESNRHWNEDLLIENVQMDVVSLAGDQTLPACIEVDETHGSVDVVDCTINNAVDASAVSARPPRSELDGPTRVNVQGSSFTGTAGSIEFDARDGSQVSTTCLSLTNDDGVVVRDSDNVAVSDATIDVSGDALVTSGSTVSTSNISYDGGCSTDSGSTDSGSTDSGSTDSGSTDSGSTSLPNTLEIVGTGVETNYEFGVSESLAGAEGSVESWDELSGTTANGWVTDSGDSDVYQYAGEVTEFTFRSGEATVYRNGTKVDPSQFAETTHTLEIVGTGVETNYEFGVSESLAGAEGSVESWDELSGTTANGWVTDSGDSDVYEFVGEVTEFTFRSGEATVYLDGTRVDPNAKWGTPDNRIEIEGGSSTTAVDYVFEVDGTLQKGSEAESQDTVGSGRAEGSVTGDVDSYTFSGSVTNFSTNGAVTVRVNGSEVDHTAWQLPNTLVFDGTVAPDQETEYVAETTGEVRVDPAVAAVESGDSAGDGSVGGVVGDDRDAYRFAGDLSRLLVRGNASVSFEDNDG
ncbi:MAG: hypothetical protein ABEJ61_01410 [Haloferacaceae archaeon]